MKKEYSYQRFKPYVDDIFSVETPNGRPLELRLVDASQRFENERQECFALLFCGPSSMLLQQSLYTLRHENLGSLDVFLVPVGRDNAGYQYEAVFNLLREPSV